jgi:PIN domain nuclease of toxin-antitoxin system
MRLLLDTHTFLWAVSGDTRLSKKARTALGSFDNDLFFSPVNAWEITTKFRIGKLPHVEPLIGALNSTLRRLGFQELPITVDHARSAGLLKSAHRDPFDRMLIAQAVAEECHLVSNEKLFDSFGVKRLW